MRQETTGLYRLELEPEVRDWLDSLSESDYKRVDEVCGMLAERGNQLGGPWSEHLDGPVWELRLQASRSRGQGNLLVPGGPDYRAAHGVPQDHAARSAAD